MENVSIIVFTSILIRGGFNMAILKANNSKKVEQKQVVTESVSAERKQNEAWVHLVDIPDAPELVGYVMVRYNGIMLRNLKLVHTYSKETNQYTDECYLRCPSYKTNKKDENGKDIYEQYYSLDKTAREEIEKLVGTAIAALSEKE